MRRRGLSSPGPCRVFSLSLSLSSPAVQHLSSLCPCLSLRSPSHVQNQDFNRGCCSRREVPAVISLREAGFGSRARVPTVPCLSLSTRLFDASPASSFSPALRDSRASGQSRQSEFDERRQTSAKRTVDGSVRVGERESSLGESHRRASTAVTCMRERRACAGEQRQSKGSSDERARGLPDSPRCPAGLCSVRGRAPSSSQRAHLPARDVAGGGCA